MLVLVVLGSISRLASFLLLIAGFVPYLVSIHVVEPWLTGRDGESGS